MNEVLSVSEGQRVVELVYAWTIAVEENVAAIFLVADGRIPLYRPSVLRLGGYIAPGVGERASAEDREPSPGITANSEITGRGPMKKTPVVGCHGEDVSIDVEITAWERLDAHSTGEHTCKQRPRRENLEDKAGDKKLNAKCREAIRKRLHRELNRAP
eukprot:Gb_16685 [translate_table: standard]